MLWGDTEYSTYAYNGSYALCIAFVDRDRDFFYSVDRLEFQHRVSLIHFIGREYVPYQQPSCSP